MAAAGPHYTLSYFDIRGMGELSRILLAAGGANWTDDRVSNWPERKASAPFGQMPLLTVDGKVLAQSGAIVRYLAKKFNLNGADDWEAAHLDSVFEHLSDIRRKYQAAGNPPDAEKRAAFFAKDLPEGLALLEKNIQGEKYIGKSNQMSYADIALYYFLWVFHGENSAAVDSIFAKSPKIKAIFDGVAANEKIAAYVKGRKVTAM